jgi:hypothetical protein
MPITCVAKDNTDGNTLFDKFGLLIRFSKAVVLKALKISIPPITQGSCDKVNMPPHSCQDRPDA